MLTADAVGRIVGDPVSVAVAIDRHRRDPARETQLGREAARIALESIGAGVSDLGVDRRGPVWPEGFVGSIAHSAGTAVAIAAKQSDRAGLGIDIERNNRALADGVIDRISTPSERTWLDRVPAGPLVLFCAKEATYKALSRFERHPVSFADVSFERPMAGRMAGRVVAHAMPFPGLHLSARTTTIAGFVVAVVEISPPSPSSRADTERAARDSR